MSTFKDLDEKKAPHEGDARKARLREPQGYITDYA
jgi:hypothetical protein